MAVFAALKVKSWIKDVTDMKNCKNRLVLLLIVLLLFQGAISCGNRSQVVNYEMPKQAAHTLSFFGNK